LNKLPERQLIANSKVVSIGLGELNDCDGDCRNQDKNSGYRAANQIALAPNRTA
jgi:hypothetical protein